MATQDIPERVVRRVLERVRPEGDCIVSTYSRGSHGYAQVSWTTNAKQTVTTCHRVAWIAAHGPIPDGMHVDHICRNRPCINLDHLQLLTHAENSAQGGPTQSANYTHCKRGHDMSVDGGVRSGQRYCKACNRLGHHRRKAARLAAQA